RRWHRPSPRPARCWAWHRSATRGSSSRSTSPRHCRTDGLVLEMHICRDARYSRLALQRGDRLLPRVRPERVSDVEHDSVEIEQCLLRAADGLDDVWTYRRGLAIGRSGPRSVPKSAGELAAVIRLAQPWKRMRSSGE